MGPAVDRAPQQCRRVSILYLTDVQFTALWWTELSYRLGALDGVVLKADVLEDPVDRVLLFVFPFRRVLRR